MVRALGVGARLGERPDRQEGGAATGVARPVAGRRGGNGVRGRRRAGPRAAGEPSAVVVRGGVACTGRTRAVAAATSAGRARWRVEQGRPVRVVTGRRAERAQRGRGGRGLTGVAQKRGGEARGRPLWRRTGMRRRQGGGRPAMERSGEARGAPGGGDGGVRAGRRRGTQGRCGARRGGYLADERQL